MPAPVASHHPSAQARSYCALGFRASRILAFATPRLDAAPELGTLREPPDPMPGPLALAARTVARDLQLDANWLNTGQALQWRAGLPPGLEQRLHWRRYSALQVGVVDRFDLVFFKLFAAVDSSGPTSVHYQDLLALRPSAEDLARSDEWATVRDIAEATAYTPTAVRRAAEDLSAARLIQALEGKPSSYRVMNAAWSPLLALTDGPPRWANWHERFVFVSAFLQWADSARERPLSAYALGAYGRDLLERHRPAFERDLVALWSPHSPIQDWVAFLQRAVHSLVNDMEEMA